jgi:hypothetical protein
MEQKGHNTSAFCVPDFVGQSKHPTLHIAPSGSGTKFQCHKLTQNLFILTKFHGVDLNKFVCLLHLYLDARGLQKGEGFFCSPTIKDGEINTLHRSIKF